ncbi:membrane protein [Intrasporangium sp. DVR]
MESESNPVDSGAMRRSVPLLNLSPRDQLRAGKLPRRVVQLLFGLTLYGMSMAMLVRATLGLDPWDVFHAGVTLRVPLTFGQVTIVVGALVLLLWIPLRQWPGLGTLSNVVVIGLAADAGLALMATPSGLAAQLGLLAGGLVLNGLAGGLYIGSQLGPGPRDGLMTGISRRTGLSLRLVRTSLELTVLAAGWVLGGPVGLGTVLYAVAIGPLVQFFLPRVTVHLEAHVASHDLAPAARPVST